ncbi:gamma-butyrobetaine dioxygenase-like [Littorina saxatilis]|uniref:Gamma-butyrobetaine dioxygenase n=1 Tax=Littorina saxatilis TaxID=31220 RepID=A0AAN9GE18_9CAEN
MWTRNLLRCANQLSSRSVTSASRHCTAACTSSVQRKGPTSVVKSEIGLRGAVPWMVHVRNSHMTAIKDRGAYDERAYQHVKGSDVKSLELVSDGKLLRVTWGDGKTSQFHSVWLRSVCFCPKCRMDHTGQCSVEFDTVSNQSRLLSAEDDGEGCLTVQWKEDPGHTGIFPLKYLKAHCYSKEAMETKRRDVQMTFSKDNVIPRVSYDEVINTRQGLYKWVKALNQTGISIVEGVPCESGMVKKVCERIADLLQHTIYGETFDVKAKARPINAAYSAGELKLHMDQPMYESAPGIQALHCIKFDESIGGGDNLFVDLFEVAETFRKQNPEEFAFLSKIPLPFETVHYERDWPVHMRYYRPMFNMNKHGDLVGVFWHPHLIGALQVEEELVEPFFEAFGKFYTLINNFPNCFRHRLKAGEMVAFNNRRVLHGRAAFTNQTGERFLQGTYIEISEFKSCVQVLSNLEGDGRSPVRVGDNDLL